ncbi:hypothetical protein [uncultured Psychroserpens sp.]|uniref:hypothetical protein n=1 Tax=uncultured Psychroserpens sp. TaxID=255436 RepID=UPI0026142443|nr:hypothetical protein [uncultured Psychroserpens sp.]
MKNCITVFISIILLSACTKTDNRKVVEQTDGITKEKNERKTVVMADLPIHIDSTNYLIHPIGNYVFSRNKSDYSEYDDYRSDSYSNTFDVSSNSGDRITGDISNLKFQNVNSNELKPLTENTVSIRSILFLRKVFKKNGKGYFLYEVIDKDTNADGDLDFNDLKSIYISNLNGTAFRKLSPHLQDLVTWKMILEANKLFFKSIEDTDRNGEFNKKDKMHYFYLDLSDEHSKVVEYYPI